MKSKKLSLAIAGALLFIGCAFASNSGCKLTKGLFDRRTALIDAGVAHGSEPSDATSGSKELERINEEYFQFFLRVASDNSRDAEWLECCSEPIEDPVAQILCKFVKYLRTGRKDHVLLVDSVPTEPRSRQALWALDSISNFHAAERGPDSIPALFKPYGPVTLYLDELYRLVTMGDKRAILKYLELYRNADSEHAEQMDDQLEDLLKNNLGVVLRKWEIFRHNRKALLRFMAFLPNEEKTLLRSAISNSRECAAHSAPCRELKSMLSIKTELTE